MRVWRRGALICLLTASALAASSAAKAEPRETAPAWASQALDHVSLATHGHNGDGVPGALRASRRGGSSTNGISYHGGPVLTTGVNVYLIWYGNWSGNTANAILPTLVSGLSGSPYYNINNTYYDGTNTKVPNLVTLAGQTTDAYSQGSSNLSDSAISAIVANAISGGLPSDPNGLYFVLTSVDVTKSGFLTSYCGWHTHGTIGGADIKYSFVGNPGSNGACSVQTSVSPNGNPGADAMASVMAHELEETATDPDLSAWWDSRGYENADKCAWTFGTTYTVSNGSKANMNLGGLNFLIQRNWVNASGGYCSLSY